MPSTEDRLSALEDSLRPLPEQVAKLVEAVDRLTDETKAIRQESREDMQALRDELREDARAHRESSSEDVRALRQDFSALQGRLTQIGFGLVGTLFASLVALVIAVGPKHALRPRSRGRSAIGTSQVRSRMMRLPFSLTT